MARILGPAVNIKVAQHAIFVHDLQSALKLTVGFSNIYCELQQISHLCVTNLSINS
jgi:hypothetical protein